MRRKLTIGHYIVTAAIIGAWLFAIIQMVFALDMRPRGNIVGSLTIHDNVSNSTLNYWNISGFQKLENTIIITEGDQDDLLDKIKNNGCRGCNFFIPCGTYTINESLVINWRGMNIRGEGSWCVLIQPAEGFRNSSLIYIPTTNKDTSSGDCIIENLNINGDNNGNLSSLINIEATNNKFYNLRMTRIKNYGIEVEKAAYWNHFYEITNWNSPIWNGSVSIYFHNKSNECMIVGGRLYADVGVVINNSEHIKLFGVSLEQSTSEVSKKDTALEINGRNSENIYLSGVRYEGFNRQINFTDIDMGASYDKPALFSIGSINEDSVVFNESVKYAQLNEDNFSTNIPIKMESNQSVFDWVSLRNFPSPCSTNYGVTAINDSTTCSFIGVWSGDTLDMQDDRIMNLLQLDLNDNYPEIRSEISTAGSINILVRRNSTNLNGLVVKTYNGSDTGGLDVELKERLQISAGENPGRVVVPTDNYFIIKANTTRAMACSATYAGAIYFDDATNKHYGCDGTNWNALY